MKTSILILIVITIVNQSYGDSIKHRHHHSKHHHYQQQQQQQQQQRYGTQLANASSSISKNRASEFLHRVSVGGAKSKQNLEANILKYLFTFGYITHTQYEHPYITMFRSMRGNERKQNYGSKDLKSALELFQSVHGLNITGEIDSDIIDYTLNYRCGNSDRIMLLENVYHKVDFQEPIIKFDNNTVTYKIMIEDLWYEDLFKRALVMYRHFTPLKFVEVDELPANIVFSMKKDVTHFVDYFPNAEKRICNFEHPMVVAHETNRLGENFTEIHINLHLEPTFYYGFDNNHDENKVNVFKIILHEIGHALGLKHSANPASIMYPYVTRYHQRNTRLIMLDTIDVQNLKTLYGKRRPYSSSEIFEWHHMFHGQNIFESLENLVIDPELNINKSNSVNIQKTYNSICELTKIDTVTVMFYHAFIFYNNSVWIKNLNSNYLRGPLSILNTFPFLEKDFGRIHAIWDRPGNFWKSMVTDKLVHTFEYPDFRSRLDSPEEKQFFGIASDANIKGIIPIHPSEIVIFYNNSKFQFYDEHTGETSDPYYLESRFKNMPKHFETVFRWVDGQLYFLNDKKYYQFNEITGKIKKSGLFSATMFGIDCPPITFCNRNTNEKISKAIEILNSAINGKDEF